MNADTKLDTLFILNEFKINTSKNHYKVIIFLQFLFTKVRI